MPENSGALSLREWKCVCEYVQPSQHSSKRQEADILKHKWTYEPFLKNEVTVVQPAKKDSKNEDPGL